jgi:hypothetical protein
MVNLAVPKGSEERIPVFLDNCVWDLLFELKLDLAKELPGGRFKLFIVRETEFEIAPIGPKNPKLSKFVDDTISKAGIRTSRVFGFEDSRHLEEQRVGGFGEAGDSAVGGVFAESDETEFEAALVGRYPQRDKKVSTHLYPNETDIALAVRSLRSVVLTLDKKKGPLLDALKRGGKIVYLNAFDPTRATLAEQVEAAWAK